MSGSLMSASFAIALASEEPLGPRELSARAFHIPTAVMSKPAVDTPVAHARLLAIARLSSTPVTRIAPFEREDENSHGRIDTKIVD